MSVQPLVMAAAVLLVAGVLLSKTSSRLGVPSLLVFLFLGMLAGSEGLLRIEFDDFELARGFGVVALAYILFGGGLSTRWSEIRPVVAPGIALATAGVIVTAVVVGGLASLILSLPLLEGLLLGAIISSTDAAAVFSILRSRGVRIRGRLRPLLELESGSNDPAAVFLTVGIIGLIAADGTDAVSLIASFVFQMGAGIVVGWALARGAVLLINRLELEYDGLYPVLTVAFVLIVYEGATWLGASGFLAAYVAGLTMANAQFIHKRSLVRFHDAIAWLMQITMFVALGLLVFPSQLAPVIGRSLLVAALLIVVARPVSALLTLLPFRFRMREIGFVSWVGLRGATPIILATFPVVAGVEDAETIFHVVFFIVLTSVLVQGTTIPAVARLLGVGTSAPPERSYPLEDALSGPGEHDLHEVVIPAGSPVVGVPLVRIGLPTGVLVVLIQRGDASIVPQGSTTLEAGDRVLVVADSRSLEMARAVLRGPA